MIVLSALGRFSLALLLVVSPLSAPSRSVALSQCCYFSHHHSQCCRAAANSTPITLSPSLPSLTATVFGSSCRVGIGSDRHCLPWFIPPLVLTIAFAHDVEGSWNVPTFHRPILYVAPDKVDFFGVAGMRVPGLQTWRRASPPNRAQLKAVFQAVRTRKCEHFFVVQHIKYSEVCWLSLAFGPGFRHVVQRIVRERLDNCRIGCPEQTLPCLDDWLKLRLLAVYPAHHIFTLCDDPSCVAMSIIFIHVCVLVLHFHCVGKAIVVGY